MTSTLVSTEKEPQLKNEEEFQQALESNEKKQYSKEELIRLKNNDSPLPVLPDLNQLPFRNGLVLTNEQVEQEALKMVSQQSPVQKKEGKGTKRELFPILPTRPKPSKQKNENLLKPEEKIISLTDEEIIRGIKNQIAQMNQNLSQPPRRLIIQAESEEESDHSTPSQHSQDEKDQTREEKSSSPPKGQIDTPANDDSSQEESQAVSTPFIQHTPHLKEKRYEQIKIHHPDGTTETQYNVIEYYE